MLQRPASSPHLMSPVLALSALFVVIQWENPVERSQFVSKIGYTGGVIEPPVADGEVKMKNLIGLNNLADECLLDQAMHFADNTCNAFNRFKCL